MDEKGTRGPPPNCGGCGRPLGPPTVETLLEHADCWGKIKAKLDMVEIAPGIRVERGGFFDPGRKT